MLRSLFLRLGLWSLLPLTVVSVGLSALITWAVNALQGQTFSGSSVWLAVGIPLVISPLMGGLQLRLLLALERAHVEVARLSLTDELTGTANRRQLFGELARLTEGGAPYALLLLDFDNFKLVNDHHGHLTGDEVLRQGSRALQASLPPQALLARFGGEEFAVLLPETGVEAALTVAERLRRAVEALGPPELPLRITVSVGVTVGSGDLEATLKQADEAMYRAKRAGKNRVLT